MGNNSENTKYGIPVDNPFINSPNKMGEIWAYGFRNPNRLAWDYYGRLLSSDLGQTNIAEINLVETGGFMAGRFVKVVLF
ncbi:PQQ-dependent sugar dehydrogenase [Aurantibacter crassamenti]|uniref:PQQ-dependent sugar dehydrogenase n=1 Tax=Aurantibacter crassamenti TaxID=1837375 RepID=UPI00193A3E2A|nr:PQQ-dependent sugar dehydrogenase [Aurantibacter crassamenti]MBM1107772.1 PQQ-dependent sugar dehydrogenase [Aurantibacter crassamenti]